MNTLDVKCAQAPVGRLKACLGFSDISLFISPPAGARIQIECVAVYFNRKLKETDRAQPRYRQRICPRPDFWPPLLDRRPLHRCTAPRHSTAALPKTCHGRAFSTGESPAIGGARGAASSGAAKRC